MADHQKTKVSEVASRDVKLLMDMLHWYANESSIKGLLNITLPTECPTPIVTKDMDSLNRTDDKGYFWDYSEYEGRKDDSTRPSGAKEVHMFADTVSQSTILNSLADSLHMSTSDLLT